jgi:hypothetical protein
MSLYGSVTRELVLFRVQIERHLKEDNLELSAGPTIRVTLPFVDLVLDDYGHPLRDRLRRRRLGMSLWVDRDTGNDLRRQYHGDAIGLDPEYKESKQ